MKSKREQGVVAWFSNAKGYGFLKRGDGSKDVFVHYTAIRGEGYKALTMGEAVEFEVSEGRQGLEAHDVLRLGTAVAQ